jgi:hypothetical protein
MGKKGVHMFFELPYIDACFCHCALMPSVGWRVHEPHILGEAQPVPVPSESSTNNFTRILQGSLPLHIYR